MISFDILGNIYPRVEQLPAVPLVEPKKTSLDIMTITLYSAIVKVEM